MLCEIPKAYNFVVYKMKVQLYLHFIHNKSVSIWDLTVHFKRC